MDGMLAEVSSPLHGTVISIVRGVGQQVGPRDAVAVVGSAATPVAVEAGLAGFIREVRAELGAAVEPGDVLVVVETGTPASIDSPVDPPGLPTSRCTSCGASELEPGFLEDRGQGSGGYGRWVEGQLEVGLFGGAERLGRRRLDIEAHRCRRCSHLELFAIDDPL